MNERRDEILERLKRIEEFLRTHVDKPMAIDEACKFLDCSKSHLYKLTSTHQIPHYKPNGKKIFFSRHELCAWITRNPVKTVSEIDQAAVDRVVLRD